MKKRLVKIKNDIALINNTLRSNYFFCACMNLEIVTGIWSFYFRCCLTLNYIINNAFLTGSTCFSTFYMEHEKEKKKSSLLFQKSSVPIASHKSVDKVQMFQSYFLSQHKGVYRFSVREYSRLRLSQSLASQR